MLVVNRFIIGSPEQVEAFTERAGQALAALAGRPGYQSGGLARALDEPSHWLLATEWESVGSYRRALGAFEVKVALTPLLVDAVNEPSAYEVLAMTDETGAVVTNASDRAAGDGQLRSAP